MSTAVNIALVLAAASSAFSSKSRFAVWGLELGLGVWMEMEMRVGGRKRQRVG